MSQFVIITNFVVVSSVGIKGFIVESVACLISDPGVASLNPSSAS